jgi:DNA repair protein RecN (Recombination protein N)
MIRSLSIQNYALINALEINFSKKLTIITGQTGAGKSIMLGALSLIMGQRADSKTLYRKDKKCIIEAIFDVSHYDLNDFFEAHDLDYEVHTNVRREITPAGKSRAFINDTPVLLSTLKAFSGQLIDLHQQFDTLDIHQASFQLKVIDAVAGNKKLLKAYSKAYKKYDSDNKKWRELVDQSREASKELDFLNYQLNELVEAAVEPDEIAALETEQKRLENAEEIKRVLGGAATHINEDEQAICVQMLNWSNQVTSLVDYHPRLPKLLEQFDSMLLELQEIGNEFMLIAEDTANDTVRLNEINNRLNKLYQLLNKYHVQDDRALIDLRDEIEKRLLGFEDLSGAIDTLAISIALQEKDLVKRGQQLSQRRQKVTISFQQQVQQLLSKLSMQHARLKVDIIPTDQIGPNGIDQLRFLFAANKGTELGEIKSLASGGEMSRLALCIKSMVADAIPLPTLVFDEIDTGVSGEVALQMGLILQAVSSKHQVISITHSPQIAAKASVHYFVRKKVEGNQTYTEVSPLSVDERILEIAKMLSGNPPSEIAKENARELLGASI